MCNNSDIAIRYIVLAINTCTVILLISPFCLNICLYCNFPWCCQLIVDHCLSGVFIFCTRHLCWLDSTNTEHRLSSGNLATGSPPASLQLLASLPCDEYQEGLSVRAGDFQLLWWPLQVVCLLGTPNPVDLSRGPEQREQTGMERRWPHLYTKFSHVQSFPFGCGLV